MLNSGYVSCSQTKSKKHGDILFFISLYLKNPFYAEKNTSIAPNKYYKS